MSAHSQDSMREYIYGRHAVVETLKHSRREILGLLQEKGDELPEIIAPLVGQRRLKIRQVSRKELDRLVGEGRHQGVVLEVHGYPYADPAELTRPQVLSVTYFMCDSLQDPQNFGGLIRSARSFGINGVIIPKDRSVSITPTVVQASAGATESLAVYQVTNLNRVIAAMKQVGYWIYGADHQAGASLNGIDFAPKVVVVLGSEGRGLRPLVARNCDVVFKIPMMSDFDSLNVAQAATIIAYEFFRKESRV